MLENLLNKKNTKGVALLGIAAFSFLLLISAVVYFIDYGFNILIITSSFETAIGAFTGSHGYVLEKLVEHVNGNVWYLIMLIIYSLASLAAVVFSVALIADLLVMFYFKSKEGTVPFNENTILIFGFNKTAFGMIENTENIKKKDIHIVSIDEFDAEQINQIARLKVSYDYFSLDKLVEQLNKKKFNRVKCVLLAETKDMNNYFLYKKLTNQSLIKNKDLRISCIPASETERSTIENETERSTIENDAAKTVNMVDLKQVIAQSVSSTVSEVICKNISNFKNKNLKCLMVGFGDTGQNVFKMLVNQLVIDSNNTITIDIVDKDAKQVFGKAMQTVCGDYKNERGIHIAKDVADGILDVNIYNYNYNDEKCISLMAGNGYDFVVLNILNNYRYIDFVENNRKLMAVLPHTHFVVPVLQFNEYCNNMKKLKVDKDVIEIENLHISKVYENYNLELLKENVIEENAIKFNYHYKSIYGNAYDQKQMWSDIGSYKRKSSLFQSIHQKINTYLRELYKDKYDEKLSIVLDMINKHRTCLEKLNGDDSDEKKRELNVSFGIEMEKVINSEPLLKELAMIEHRRWTYFMIFEGFKYDKAKNDNLKHNDCITNWSLLSKDKKDVLIYDLIPFIMLIGRDAQIINENTIAKKI